MRRDEWQAVFVESLQRTGQVRIACQLAGVSPDTAYRYRRIDERFRERWDAADLCWRNGTRREANRRLGFPMPTAILNRG